MTRIDYHPVAINKAACTESFVVDRDTAVHLGTGYSRTLKAGGRWDCVGGVPSGSVFRSKDQTMTVEASNIYEAYLVLSGGTLVGFYLPGNDAYFALAKPVAVAGRYVEP